MYKTRVDQFFFIAVTLWLQAREAKTVHLLDINVSDKHVLVQVTRQLNHLITWIPL